MDVVLLSFGGFLLVLCRITAFFVVVPVFSSRNVPNRFKIGLAFFVALITFAAMEFQPVPMDGLYVLSILKEILVGLVLGFTAYLFFTVVQIAGSFVDMQMGLAMANVIDPVTGVASPVVGNLKYVVAMLLFLSYNGHHYLLQAIMESYQLVPLDYEALSVAYDGPLAEFLARTFVTTFAIALKMALPLMVALFLTDVGLGLLTRAAPQFNVFVVGIPVKILVGFALLAILMPGLVSVFDLLFNSLFQSLRELLGILGGTPGSV